MPKPLRRHSHFWISILLAAITLAVYWQVLDHSFILYDDDEYVAGNPHVQDGLTWKGIAWAFTRTHSANWHPLTWVSHMVDVQLFGMDPMGHHLTNLLLHVANVLLLFLAMARMTGYVWRSAFVAALFAVHPLHVESVAWVAERKDVLSTLFMLLTMWAYARYAERPGIGRYIPVFVLLALGLMAKPMLVTLPLVLLLLDYWPLHRLMPMGAKPADQWRKLRGLAVEKIPLFLLSVTSCIITYIVQQNWGAMKPMAHVDLSARLMNALAAYPTYIGKMLWPGRLAVLYPHPGSDLPLWQPLVGGLLLALATVLALKAARRYPYVAVGWLWYVITLVPVIGVVQVGMQAVADRYTYVPLTGIFILIGWGVGDLAGRQAIARHLVSAGAAIVTTVLAVCAWHQAGYWLSSTTLFERTLNVTKNNYPIHNNLGNALRERKAYEEAEYHYREALRIKPDYAPSHNNLGTVLAERGDTARAVRHFTRAVELEPAYASAHFNLGTALANAGKYNKAVEHFTKAIRLSPEYWKAHVNLAVVYYSTGEYEKAWQEVHLAEECGAGMPQAIIDGLSQAMPEP